MTEKARLLVTIIDKLEYREGINRRLLQESLAEGVICLLMFEMVGDEKRAGSVPFQFDKIKRGGPVGTQPSDRSFVFSSHFLSEDYTPIARAYSGAFSDGFVRFDDPLMLRAPINRQIGQGIILPEQDGIDITLEAMQSLDESLLLSN